MFERVKHGVIFAGLLALLAMAPTRAEACSCLATTFEQARAESAAIFEGRVVGMDAEGDDVVVHFRVTQAWRGVEHEQLDVRMPAGPAACGYPFQEGVVYLVYARSTDDGLHTSLCSRTAPMDDEVAMSDRQAQGSGTIPIDVEDTTLTLPPARMHVGCASCTASHSAPTCLQSAFALLGLAFVAQRARRSR